jgi:hypothetical protein
LKVVWVIVVLITPMMGIGIMTRRSPNIVNLVIHSPLWRGPRLVSTGGQLPRWWRMWISRHVILITVLYGLIGLFLKTLGFQPIKSLSGRN